MFYLSPCFLLTLMLVLISHNTGISPLSLPTKALNLTLKLHSSLKNFGRHLIVIR